MKQELIDELKERLEKTHTAIELNQRATIDKEDELEEQKFKLSLIELEVSQKVIEDKATYTNADSRKIEIKKRLDISIEYQELSEDIKKAHKGKKIDEIVLSSLKRRHKMDILFLDTEVK